MSAGGLRKAHWILIGAFALALTTALALKFLRTDRHRVRRVARKVIGRLESLDAAGTCVLLAEDFRDPYGHQSRRDFRADLTIALRMLEELSISIYDLEVAELHEDTAVVEFYTLSLVKQRDRRRAWKHRTRVRLHLRKEEGEWRVAAAEYQLPDGVRRRL